MACGSHKTLSALGRWFGFELDEIFSGLVGSAGCKIPGLVWVRGSAFHPQIPGRPAGALGGALPYGEVRAKSAADAYLALTRK